MEGFEITRDLRKARTEHIIETEELMKKIEKLKNYYLEDFDCATEYNQGALDALRELSEWVEAATKLTLRVDP